jgi:hypothetical protein
MIYFIISLCQITSICEVEGGATIDAGWPVVFHGNEVDWEIVGVADWKDLNC